LCLNKSVLELANACIVANPSPTLGRRLPETLGGPKTGLEARWRSYAILPAPLKRHPECMNRYSGLTEERMRQMGWQPPSETSPCATFPRKYLPASIPSSNSPNMLLTSLNRLAIIVSSLLYVVAASSPFPSILT